MNDFSISITCRTGFGDREHEETIHIGHSSQQQTPSEPRVRDANGNRVLKSTHALAQIATQLKCENNLGDMLQAIDRLAAPSTPTIEWIYGICDDKEVDKATADKAIAALGNGARYPTLAEQESSRDITRCNPACDPLLHPQIRPGAYWTDEPYAPGRVCFWVVGFDDGSSVGLHRDYGAFVRAVRSVPAGQ